MELRSTNLTSPLPTSTTTNSSFTLSAKAPTDIWRKPPSTVMFNAPIIYHSLPQGAFRGARVTVSARWATLYDQGGLILVIPPPAGSSSSNPDKDRKWVKSGIEFYHGKPFMSVVAAESWADWSLCPLAERAAEKGSVTIEFEREIEEGKPGSVLRVWMVDGEERTVVREVAWAFLGDEEKEVWVGAFCAKPTEGEGELVVKFEGFEVVTA